MNKFEKVMSEALKECFAQIEREDLLKLKGFEK